MNNILQWLDPETTIWGFHVHQELDESDFAKSLIIQQGCHDFLLKRNVIDDADDAIKAGYGPHVNPMWELRVESQKTDVLKHLGAMLSFMAINRSNLPAYIHPLMHNPALPALDALRQEGETNQVNALWFGHRVAQHQDFFFNPPLHADRTIVDTRTERIFSIEERKILYAQGQSEWGEISFRDPQNEIINGFHIHVDYEEKNAELAYHVFKQFMIYLLEQEHRPTSHRFYAEKENGPHVQRGWEVKFETSDPSVLETIGIAVGWLMCNRQGLNVFMHPVTWVEGEDEHAQELKAHEEYAFFIGELPPLDLGFFKPTMK
jgi:aromatic ring-cleaving dioxygenase